MAYVVDRQHALWSRELVAVLSVRQRKVRSRVVLRDNSLYHTLTRAKTFIRQVNGERRSRRHVGAIWRNTQ